MSPETAPAPKARGWVRLLIAFIVAFDVAAFFQWADGAFQSEFGGHPDEAAHYLSGVRVRDAAVQAWERARSGGGDSLPQPAAALTQTSMFDVAQGGWMLAFGTSRIAVLLFMAALAAATALLIFSTVRREFGEWAAVVAATLWLCAPAVRESYETILPGLLGAFVFSGAALLGARLLDARGPRFTAIGRWIGTAVVIGGGCVLALALAVTFKLCPGNPQAALLFLKECAFVLGIAAAVFALAGMVIRRRSEARKSVLWVALAALVAGVLFARWMKAGIPDVRVLIVATPALAILATRGAVSLAGIIGFHAAIGEQSRRKALWLLLLLLLSLPPYLLTARQKDWEGFGPIAITLIEQAQGAERVLVVSDPRGEGMLISEIAMRDRERQITIERGSETLVESPNPDARPLQRFLEDEQLLAHLAAGSIRYVVLDSSVPGASRASYHDQALRVLEGNVSNFWPIYDNPLVRDGEPQGHPLRIFRVLPSNGVQLQPQ
jgi:Trk K+ transport system NAD-binding subunit